MLKIYIALVLVVAVTSAVPRRSRCTTEQSGPTPVPPYRTVQVEDYYIKVLVPVVELQYTPPPYCYRGVLVVTACDDVAPNVMFRSANDVVVVRKGSLLQTAVVKAKYLCPSYFGNQGKSVPVWNHVPDSSYQDSQCQDYQVDSVEVLPYQDQQGPSYAGPSYAGPSYAVPSNIGSSYAVPSNVGSSYAVPSNVRSPYGVPSSVGSYGVPSNVGSSYAVPSNVGSSYAVPSKVGSSYSVPSNVGSSYGVPSNLGLTYSGLSN